MLRHAKKKNDWPKIEIKVILSFLFFFLNSRTQPYKLVLNVYVRKVKKKRKKKTFIYRIINSFENVFFWK